MQIVVPKSVFRRWPLWDAVIRSVPGRRHRAPHSYPCVPDDMPIDLTRQFVNDFQEILRRNEGLQRELQRLQQEGPAPDAEQAGRQEQTLRRLQNELAQLSDQSAQLRQDLHDTQRNLEEFKAQTQSLSLDKSRLETKLATVDDHVRSLNHDLAEAESSIRNLETENARLTTRLQDAAPRQAHVPEKATRRNESEVSPIPSDTKSQRTGSNVCPPSVRDTSPPGQRPPLRVRCPHCSSFMMPDEWSSGSVMTCVWCGKPFSAESLE
ncbi:MAG: hypothetical protein ACC628_08140 [Pirellulaceae bacterium]